MNEPGLQSTAAAAADTTAVAPATTVSRLRSGGLLRAAAGLAASAALSTAQASVVYSGEVDVTFQRLGSIVNVELAPGATLGMTGSYRGKDSQYVALYVSEAAGFSVLGTAADVQVAQGLSSGVSVDVASAFSLGDDPVRTQDHVGTTDDFFIGFDFNPTGSGPHYGWMHFLRNDGLNWHMVGYAYEDSGQEILTGQTGGTSAVDPNAVPEPGSLPLILAAGGIFGLLRLRCGDARAASIRAQAAKAA